MRCRTVLGADSGAFSGSSRLISAAKQNAPSEIDRYEFARCRAHSGPHARVPKRTGGGGVSHA